MSVDGMNIIAQGQNIHATLDVSFVKPYNYVMEEEDGGISSFILTLKVTSRLYHCKLVSSRVSDWKLEPCVSYDISFSSVHVFWKNVTKQSLLLTLFLVADDLVLLCQNVIDNDDILTTSTSHNINLSMTTIAFWFSIFSHFVDISLMLSKCYISLETYGCRHETFALSLYSFHCTWDWALRLPL